MMDGEGSKTAIVRLIALLQASVGQKTRSAAHSPSIFKLGNLYNLQSSELEANWEGIHFGQKTHGIDRLQTTSAVQTRLVIS